METIYKTLVTLLFLGLAHFSISQDTYATASDLGTLSCAGSPYNNIAAGNNTGASNECGNTSGDEWYSFTITSAADVSMSLCNSGFDTYLRFYNSGAANCAGAGQIAGNDDNGPVCGGTRSSITQTALAAGTYIVMVEGYSSNEGAYQLDITVSNCAIPMVFVSSTTTQTNTSTVEKCASNQEIIGVEVVMSGSLIPMDLDTIHIQTNGSTDPMNDVGNIDIYYTGTSSTFATTTLVGSAAPLTVGNDIAINTTQTLVNGTNYFWVVYDLAAGALIGNDLDALCNQIMVDGSNEVPTVTTIAGTRTIDACIGSPGGIAANLNIWHKADANAYSDAGATLATDGDGVQQWNDQTTTNVDVTAASAAARPIYDEDGMNYNPALEFDGTDDFFIHNQL